MTGNYSPTPPPPFHRCRRLGACNKGRDPVRKGTGADGDGVVVGVSMSGNGGNVIGDELERDGTKKGPVLRRVGGNRPRGVQLQGEPLERNLVSVGY